MHSHRFKTLDQGRYVWTCYCEWLLNVCRRYEVDQDETARDILADMLLQELTYQRVRPEDYKHVEESVKDQEKPSCSRDDEEQSKVTVEATGEWILVKVPKK